MGELNWHRLYSPGTRTTFVLANPVDAASKANLNGQMVEKVSREGQAILNLYSPVGYPIVVLDGKEDTE